jgi:hypothetical protein
MARTAARLVPVANDPERMLLSVWVGADDTNLHMVTWVPTSTTLPVGILK